MNGSKWCVRSALSVINNKYCVQYESCVHIYSQMYSVQQTAEKGGGISPVRGSV